VRHALADLNRNANDSYVNIPEPGLTHDLILHDSWQPRPSVNVTNHMRQPTPRAPNPVRRQSNHTDPGLVSHAAASSTAPFGARAENGDSDLRFFGSTTQPHINSTTEKVAVSHEEDDCGLDRSLNMDSMQLRKSILKTYFEVQLHAQIVVREDLFTSDKRKGERSRHYSQFLENCMLASGTRYSTSSAVRALGKRFAERAKSLISSEIDDANIATLQGFLLLSDFEATRGSAKVGWTYCGKSALLKVLLTYLNIFSDCGRPHC